MQIDAILCNHAEAVNNMLYISGGGAEIGQVAPGVNPPYPVSLGIGIMLSVPWGQTNQQHTVEIELLGEDGLAVDLPTGPESTGPLKVQLAFNVGRSPMVTAGDDQHVCLAANLPAVPLPAIGKYEFVIRIDGHDERRLPYRLMSLAGALAFGSATPGPAGAPR